MNHPKPFLLLIIGIMAAGKSSVAQAIAERLPKSVHLRGDVFRRMIVGGQADMDTELSAEARRQLDLRYKIAANVAGMYLDAGFSVIYQDIILGDDLRRTVQMLDHLNPHVVVLSPDAETVARREAGRGKKGYGAMPIGAFDDFLRNDTPNIGLRLDTSEQQVAETATTILARLPEARISPN